MSPILLVIPVYAHHRMPVSAVKKFVSLIFKITCSSDEFNALINVKPGSTLQCLAIYSYFKFNIVDWF